MYKKGQGRRRYGKITEVWHGGLQGTGRNITTAKEDLATKVDAALEGSYVPVLVHVADSPLAALVWRDLHGWQYTIIGTTEKPSGKRISMLNGSSSGGPDATAKEVERSARKHLAQCILEFDGEQRTGMEVLQDEADRADHASYVKWQWVYRVWTLSSMGSEKAQDMAWKRQFPEGVSLAWSEDQTTAQIVSFEVLA